MDTFKQRLIICILLTISLILLWIVESPLKNQSTLLISTIIFFYGGQPLFKAAIKELKNKNLGSMSLVTITITIAYIYIILMSIEGKVTIVSIELALIINIILSGRWIETKLTEGILKPLKEPENSIPPITRLIEDGKIKEIHTETIKPGDLILVKKGEIIPSDGIIIKGSTTIQPTTGKITVKGPGETVTATSLNIKSPILVETTKVGEESFVSQLIKVLKRKNETKIQESINKIVSIFILIIIAVAITTFIYWENTTLAIEHALTVLIVASPQAIRLAAPIPILVSAVIAAKNGIIIKNKNSHENARQIDAIAFNKTGTLTMGKFKVTDIISFDKELEEGDIINYVAAIESKSQHPIAKGIREVVKEPLPVKKLKKIQGKGITGCVGDAKIQIINYKHLNDLGFRIENPEILEMTEKGKTVIFVVINDELKGCIGLTDKIKKEAKKTIKTLKDNGIKCIMLTGDNKKVAKWTAKELGLDEYYAELTAEEKSEKIKKMQEDGLKVAMIGQADDMPAIKQANLGIAMITHPNIDIENPDIILTEDNLLEIPRILELATATHNKIKENLTWATIYNTITIPIATGILQNQNISINAPIGAALMILSIMIVILNAKTLHG
ncbi:copper-transporting ATPase [Methanothermobacter sp. MT-2]|nr:copper-transporting ATPase [Methanothermobacter sp. MT-2]HOK72704.1 heavy metal translocating P-type ATPase [Methanothermobacter sp.]